MLKNATALLILLNVSIASADGGLETLIDADTIRLVSGYQQALNDAPAAAVVISRADIERTGSFRLSDVLERVTGLHISPSSDAIATITTIRGIRSRLLILYNGIPLTQGLVNGAGNLDSVLLHDVDRIEIMKGPNSAVYGADAVSGVVNMITKDETDAQPQAGVLFGNDRTGNVWSRVTGSLGDDRDISLYLARHQTDGSQGLIDSDRASSIDLIAGTRSSLAPGNLNSRKTINEARLAIELTDRLISRWWVYDQDDLGTGVGQSQALDPIGRNNYTLVTGELLYDSDFGPWGIASYLTYASLDARGDQLHLLPPGTLGFPDGVIQDLGVRETRWRGELSGVLELPGHTIRVGGGVVSSRWTNQFDRRNYTIVPGIPLPVPIGPLTEFKETDPIFPDDVSRNWFVYGQDEWQFANDWRVTTGIRFDDYSYFGTTTNPRLGLIWSAGLHTSVKLLYGEAFRPPDPIERRSNGLFLGLGNSDIKPSDLRMTELLIDHGFTDDLSMRASVFDYSFSNLVGLIPNSDSPNGLGYTNLPGNQSGHGFDWSTDWRIHPAVRLQLGFSYHSIDTLPANTHLRFNAQQLAHIEVDFSLPREWHLNALVFGVFGRDRNNGDDRSAIDDYQVVNLALTRKRLWREFDLSINAQNLLNEDAREPISSAIANDAPVYPRQVYLQLESDF